MSKESNRAWRIKNREYLRGYGRARYNSDQRKMRYALKRAQGLCGQTGCKRQSTKSMCDKCAEKNLSRMAKKYKAHKPKNKCVYCVRAALPTTILCKKHKEAQKVCHLQRKEARKLAGLCQRCGGKKPTTDNRLCDACRTYFRTYQREAYAKKHL